MPDLRVIIDTGPIVAYLHKQEQHHQWTVDQFRNFPAPFLTCEPVLTEALFLLRRVADGPRRLFDLLDTGAVAIEFALREELEPISRFIARYSSVPASLADACLVRMTELHEEGAVFTLDSDFAIYRKNGRQHIPVIMPSAH